MNNKVMSGKTAKILVIVSAFFLILLGIGLYELFDYQGYGVKKANNTFVNYNVKDYIETTPVVFNNYSDVYSSINVSRLSFKNLDDNLIKSFINEENEAAQYAGEKHGQKDIRHGNVRHVLQKAGFEDVSKAHGLSPLLFDRI